MNKYILLATAALAMGATAYGQTGNVGIGTTTPQAKLHINAGNTPATVGTGFKLVDGSQATGKVLTSNAEGTAHWEYPAVTYQNIVSDYKYVNRDSLFYGSMMSTEDTFFRNTKAYIDLPPGKYLVQITGNISTIPVSSSNLPPLNHAIPPDTANYAHPGESLYLTVFLLDQNVNYIPRNQNGGPVAQSSLNSFLPSLAYPYKFQSHSGNLIVYNNTTTTKRYYVFARPMAAVLYQNRRIYEFMSARWGEENLSAIKIGD